MAITICWCIGLVINYLLITFNRWGYWGLNRWILKSRRMGSSTRIHSRWQFDIRPRGVEGRLLSPSGCVMIRGCGSWTSTVSYAIYYSISLTKRTQIEVLKRSKIIFHQHTYWVKFLNLFVKSFKVRGHGALEVRLQKSIGKCHGFVQKLCKVLQKF